MFNPYELRVSPHVLLSRHERWRRRAKLRNLSKAARQRLEWFVWHETHGQNVALTCRHFGIARKTWYHWAKRFDELHLRSLEERSRAPHRVRTPAYTPLETLRIRQLRQQYPTAGREKLVVLYAEDFGVAVQPWSVRRIIHDYRLHAQRAVHKKRSSGRRRGIHKKRVTELLKQPRCGFLVEADTIVEYGNNEKRYILTAVDHHSRLAFARMYPTKASRHAADFLRRLVLLLDGQLEHLHVDNGSEFTGAFLEAADELQIPLYHTRPYQPKDKPLVERFNGILQQEHIDLGHFTTDVDRFNRDLTDWLIYYNCKRPHRSLGLRRPAECAKLTYPRQVLPMSSPLTFT
jgi:transposase InsO family protein